jgi:hypothetical protein
MESNGDLINFPAEWHVYVSDVDVSLNTEA